MKQLLSLFLSFCILFTSVAPSWAQVRNSGGVWQGVQQVRIWSVQECNALRTKIERNLYGTMLVNPVSEEVFKRNYREWVESGCLGGVVGLPSGYLGGLGASALDYSLYASNFNTRRAAQRERSLQREVREVVKAIKSGGKDEETTYEQFKAEYLSSIRKQEAGWIAQGRTAEEKEAIRGQIALMKKDAHIRKEFNKYKQEEEALKEEAERDAKAQLITLGKRIKEAKRVDLAEEALPLFMAVGAIDPNVRVWAAQEMHNKVFRGAKFCASFKEGDMAKCKEVLQAAEALMILGDADKVYNRNKPYIQHDLDALNMLWENGVKGGMAPSVMLLLAGGMQAMGRTAVNSLGGMILRSLQVSKNDYDVDMLSLTTYVEAANELAHGGGSWMPQGEQNKWYLQGGTKVMGNAWTELGKALAQTGIADRIAGQCVVANRQGYYMVLDKCKAVVAGLLMGGYKLKEGQGYRGYSLDRNGHSHYSDTTGHYALANKKLFDLRFTLTGYVAAQLYFAPKADTDPYTKAYIMNEMYKVFRKNALTTKVKATGERRTYKSYGGMNGNNRGTAKAMSSYKNWQTAKRWAGYGDIVLLVVGLVWGGFSLVKGMAKGIKGFAKAFRIARAGTSMNGATLGRRLSRVMRVGRLRKYGVSSFRELMQLRAAESASAALDIRSIRATAPVKPVPVKLPRKPALAIQNVTLEAGGNTVRLRVKVPAEITGREILSAGGGEVANSGRTVVLKGVPNNTSAIAKAIERQWNLWEGLKSGRIRMPTSAEVAAAEARASVMEQRAAAASPGSAAPTVVRTPFSQRVMQGAGQAWNWTKRALSQGWNGSRQALLWVWDQSRLVPGKVKTGLSNLPGWVSAGWKDFSSGVKIRWPLVLENTRSLLMPRSWRQAFLGSYIWLSTLSPAFGAGMGVVRDVTSAVRTEQVVAAVNGTSKVVQVLDMAQGAGTVSRTVRSVTGGRAVVGAAANTVGAASHAPAATGGSFTLRTVFNNVLGGLTGRAAASPVLPGIMPVGIDPRTEYALGLGGSHLDINSVYTEQNMLGSHNPESIARRNELARFAHELQSMPAGTMVPNVIKDPELGDADAMVPVEYLWESAMQYANRFSFNEADLPARFVFEQAQAEAAARAAVEETKEALRLAAAEQQVAAQAEKDAKTKFSNYQSRVARFLSGNVGVQMSYDREGYPITGKIQTAIANVKDGLYINFIAPIQLRNNPYYRKMKQAARAPAASSMANVLIGLVLADGTLNMPAVKSYVLQTVRAHTPRNTSGVLSMNGLGVIMPLLQRIQSRVSSQKHVKNILTATARAYEKTLRVPVEDRRGDFTDVMTVFMDGEMKHFAVPKRMRETLLAQLPAMLEEARIAANLPGAPVVSPTQAEALAFFKNAPAEFERLAAYKEGLLSEKVDVDAVVTALQAQVAQGIAGAAERLNAAVEAQKQVAARLATAEKIGQMLNTSLAVLESQAALETITSAAAVSPSSSSGILYSGIPVMGIIDAVTKIYNFIKNWFAAKKAVSVVPVLSRKGKALARVEASIPVLLKSSLTAVLQRVIYEGMSLKIPLIGRWRAHKQAAAFAAKVQDIAAHARYQALLAFRKEFGRRFHLLNQNDDFRKLYQVFLSEGLTEANLPENIKTAVKEQFNKMLRDWMYSSPASQTTHASYAQPTGVISVPVYREGKVIGTVEIKQERHFKIQPNQSVYIEAVSDTEGKMYLLEYKETAEKTPPDPKLIRSDIPLQLSSRKNLASSFGLKKITEGLLMINNRIWPMFCLYLLAGMGNVSSVVSTFSKETFAMSNMDMYLMGGVSSVAMGVMSLFVGIWQDRLSYTKKGYDDRRGRLIITNLGLISAILSFALPWLVGGMNGELGAPELWKKNVLIVSFLLLGVSAAFLDVAMKPTLMAVSHRADYSARVGYLSVFKQTVGNVSNYVVPPIAMGLAVAFGGFCDWTIFFPVYTIVSFAIASAYNIFKMHEQTLVLTENPSRKEVLSITKMFKEIIGREKRKKLIRRGVLATAFHGANMSIFGLFVNSTVQGHFPAFNMSDMYSAAANVDGFSGVISAVWDVMSNSWLGYSMLLFTVPIIVGRFIGTSLTKQALKLPGFTIPKQNSGNLLKFSVAVVLLGIVAVHLPWWWAQATGIILLGLGLTNISPIIGAYTTDNSRHASNAVSALLSASTLLGFTLSTIFGWLLDANAGVLAFAVPVGLLIYLHTFGTDIATGRLLDKGTSEEKEPEDTDEGEDDDLNIDDALPN